MRPLTVTCCALLAALSLGLCLCPVPRAAAANFTVNSLADTPDAQPGDGVCADANGNCTLRAALQEGSGNGVIGFAVTGTINLTGALPTIFDLTINGPGAGSLTVRRDTGGDYRIFTVGGHVTASINGLTITNGLAANASGGIGGGILNSGTLSMSNCVVSGNATANQGGLNLLFAGGGIFNEGTLTLTNCTVNNNATGDGSTGNGNTYGGSGGGIYNTRTLTLNNCEVSFNRAGRGATTSTGGGGGGHGGGIYNADTLTMSACDVRSNSTGNGADAVQGVVSPAGKGGSGGGVYNSGTTTAVNCVFSGNATGSGGKSSGVNCGQGDGGDGGGIANAGGTLKLSQSTVVNNQAGLLGEPCGRDGQGGGVYGGARSRSSIYAFNYSRASNGAREIFGGAFDSRGYNYIGVATGTCCFTNTDHFGSSIDQTNLGLDGNLLPRCCWSLDTALALDVDDVPVLTDKRGLPRPIDFPNAPWATQPGTDQSDMGAFERQFADPTPTPPTVVQFTGTAQSVGEGCVQADVILKREGPTDGTTSANYLVTNVVNTAFQRGDFTEMSGTVTFAPGEDTKIIPVLITEDAYAEGTESFVVYITDVQGGERGSQYGIRIDITDNDATDGTANPIDDNAIFVGQHYHDFLSRQADAAGLAFWKDQLDACNGDAACLDRKRVDISAAFILSIEFQQTGYFAIRVRKAAFGSQPENPDYYTFLRDTQGLGRGVVVGEPHWEQGLEFNKQRFVEAIVSRPDFLSAHASQSAEQYVDSLFANVGVTPTNAERQAALAAHAPTVPGLASALRSVVESASVYNKLYNPGFVLAQYYGYLRRNPNERPDNNFDGYNYWLSKLDQFTLPGEDARDESVALSRVRRAEMVRAFLLSAEYRGRFQGEPNRGAPF